MAPRLIEMAQPLAQNERIGRTMLAHDGEPVAARKFQDLKDEMDKVRG